MTLARLVTPDDAPALAELLAANRRFLAPFEPHREESYFTVAGQHDLVEQLLTEHARGTRLPWVILDEAGRVAGRITLNEIVRGPFQSASLGYWLAQSRTRRGLATSAVRDIAQAAFGDLGLHRLQAGTLVHNTASQRVLERTGFTRYGLAPAYLRIDGRWQDHVLHQLISPHPDD